MLYNNINFKGDINMNNEKDEQKVFDEMLERDVDLLDQLAQEILEEESIIDALEDEDIDDEW